jgi:hypothetical protein
MSRLNQVRAPLKMSGPGPATMAIFPRRAAAPAEIAESLSMTRLDLGTCSVQICTMTEFIRLAAHGKRTFRSGGIRRGLHRFSGPDNPHPAMCPLPRRVIHATRFGAGFFCKRFRVSRTVAQRDRLNCSGDSGSELSTEHGASRYWAPSRTEAST